MVRANNSFPQNVHPVLKEAMGRGAVGEARQTCRGKMGETQRHVSAQRDKDGCPAWSVRDRTGEESIQQGRGDVRWGARVKAGVRGTHTGRREEPGTGLWEPRWDEEGRQPSKES